MPRGESLTALSVGEVMVELIRPVGTLPSPNTTFVVRDEPRAVGGAALNVAWHLGHLGDTVQLVSPIGERDVEDVRKELSPAAVGLDGLVQLKGHSDTLVALVTSYEHQSVYMLATLPEDFAQRIARQCNRADLLVLNGGRHPQIREFYRSSAIRQIGGLIFFNPSYAITEYAAPEIQAVLEQVDIVVVNADEYEYLEGTVGAAGIARFVDHPNKFILATRAADGVDLHSRTGVIRVRSRIEKPGMYLGAGDAFLAGCASELANGQDMEDAIQFGLEAAAQVVRTAEIRPRLRATAIRRAISNMP